MTMVDEVSQQLFDWGKTIRQRREADVVAIDFRDAGGIRAALIAVRKTFSLGTLVPQLIALAFNMRRASDIESAVEASGLPGASVQWKFSTRPDRNRQDEGGIRRQCGTMAMVVSDDGDPDPLTPAASNHEIARMLSQMTKRPVVYVDVPENIARQSMRQLGMPASLVEALLQHGSA
jgi:hypothetical protein